MESKFDQLTKLKQLLDSGALTQEEFDAAKKRILDSDNAPEASVNQQASAPSTANTESKQKNYIIIAVVGIIAIAAIIGLVSTCSGKDEFSQAEEYAVTVDDSQLIPAEEMVEEAVDISALDDNGNYVDKDDTHYNDWVKSYFRDDFDEYNYSKPYIRLLVPDGRRIVLGILYRPSGSFTFKLFDDDGDIHQITASYANLGFRANGIDIGPCELEVVSDEVHITHPDDIKTISTVFNYGDFKISFDYVDGLGETQHYVFSVSNPQNEFKRAIDHLLGTEYFGQ